METIELTRKELYDIIWSTPLSKLTQQYEFTNDEIKKICKEFEIPMPEGGHWMKLKFNKIVKKEKLNPIFGGVYKIVFPIRNNDNPENLDQKSLTIRTKENDNDSNASLIILDGITKLDILIQNTKRIHENSKKKGFKSDEKTDTVSIYVEESNFNRALLIMDSFVKLLRDRGHSFRRDRNNWGPHIVVNDIEFSFYLREIRKRIPSDKPFNSCTYNPTGILVMKIGESFKAKEWKDGSIKLEKQLVKIVTKIELEAEVELIWREQCRLDKIQREEEKNRLAEIKKRKDDEVDKFNRLVKLSEQYDKTLLIRQYIEARKQRAIDTNSLTLEKQEWIRWATDKGDWLDPLINKPDDILDS
jgi:hypothetical protein